MIQENKNNKELLLVRHLGDIKMFITNRQFNAALCACKSADVPEHRLPPDYKKTLKTMVDSCIKHKVNGIDVVPGPLADLTVAFAKIYDEELKRNSSTRNKKRLRRRK